MCVCVCVRACVRACVCVYSYALVRVCACLCSLLYYGECSWHVIMFRLRIIYILFLSFFSKTIDHWTSRLPCDEILSCRHTKVQSVSTLAMTNVLQTYGNISASSCEAANTSVRTHDKTANVRPFLIFHGNGSHALFVAHFNSYMHW